jgi:hypothetical protein
MIFGTCSLALNSSTVAWIFSWRARSGHIKCVTLPLVRSARSFCSGSHSGTRLCRGGIFRLCCRIYFLRAPSPWRPGTIKTEEDGIIWPRLRMGLNALRLLGRMLSTFGEQRWLEGLNERLLLSSSSHDQCADCDLVFRFGERCGASGRLNISHV